MVPKAYGTARKVVMTRAGSGTGDTVYVDDRGDTWLQTPVEPRHPDQTCPPMVGTLVGGTIIPGKQ